MVLPHEASNRTARRAAVILMDVFMAVFQSKKDVSEARRALALTGQHPIEIA